MTSVVIPAHNEGETIERCLDSIVADPEIDHLEILVVCNGCTDDTAARARAYGPRVKVIETEVAGKPTALRLGDEHAQSYPRCYVDADVVVSPGCVSGLRDAMAERSLLAAAPAICLDATSSTWPVRQFYDTWRKSPYVRHELVGAGFYALSEQGRARFDEFPDLVADDLFVRQLFTDSERGVVAEHSFTPMLPRDLRALLRAEMRHHAANDELWVWHHERGDQVSLPGDRHGHGWLLSVASSPPEWLTLGVYVGVKATAIASGKVKLRWGDMQRWNQAR